MVKLCGASLGVFAFAVTIILGLLAGNPPETILLRAVWAMFLFCLIGLSVGWVASRVVDEHVAQLRATTIVGEEGTSPPGDSSGSVESPSGGGGDARRP